MGMRERVRLAAGGLRIISSPGSGTVVRARLSAVSSEAGLQAMISERRGSRIEMERPEQSRPTEETADAQTPSSPRRNA